MTGLSVELSDLTKIYESGRGGGSEVPAIDGVSLGIHSGEFFTLLGPSGCGKTTILRLIAGFIAPTRGEVFIEGAAMQGVPPYRRPVNIVFQNYALFPHLTVAQNVGFGPAVKRMPRPERERRVHEMLDLVRLPDMGDRKPAHLSGGQQQRVALARALVNEPAVLLLDEPLGALDLKLRKQMQIELKHLQQQVGITFIYVTHDQEEALTMSERIAVMSEGKMLQVGDPVTVYEKPATRFVADFIGESNLLTCTVDSVDSGEARVWIAGERVCAQSNGAALSPREQVTLAIRPEKLSLAPVGEQCGPALTGTIREIVYVGTDTRFIVDLSSGEQVVARLQNVGGKGLGEFSVGEQVKVLWTAHDARVLSS